MSNENSEVVRVLPFIAAPSVEVRFLQPEQNVNEAWSSYYESWNEYLRSPGVLVGVDALAIYQIVWKTMLNEGRRVFSEKQDVRLDRLVFVAQNAHGEVKAITYFLGTTEAELIAAVEAAARWAATSEIPQ
jgi:hypothetical protein